MRLLNQGLCWLVFAVFPFTLMVSAQDAQTAASTPQAAPSITLVDQSEGSQTVPVANNTVTELPDSPGAVQTQTESPQQGTQAPQAPTTQSGSTQTAAPAPAAQQSKPQRPVGTAAAEAPMVSGISAAQPAGVAIAPAKQRRVRTLVIKVGAIVGAGVALGTTLALTRGTPSKPPGAH